jgi:hypothetical protein
MIVLLSLSKIAENQSLQVVTEVATNDAASAEAASNNLQKEILQKQLQNQGLPGGEVLSTTIKVVTNHTDFP